VYSEGDKIVKVEGDPENPKSHGTCCTSGMSQREIHNNALEGNKENRILYPMRRVGERGSGQWERISWDEAMDTIVGETNRIREQYGPQSVLIGQGTGRTWNHWHCRINSSLGQEGWGLTPTHVCLMPNIVPNALTLGIFSTPRNDVRNARTVVLWGQNPTYELAWIKDVFQNQREGKSKIIVIDVRYHDAAKHADLFLQPRPGTDGALALAFMHVLIEEDMYDADFIDKWTYGFDELAERCKEWTPERAAEICDIPAEDIYEAAYMMGKEGPVAVQIGLGPSCMHTNGIQTGRALSCLQGLLGYIDVKGGTNVPLSFGVMLDDRITLWDPEKAPGRPELFQFGGEDHLLYKAMGRSNVPKDVFRAIVTGEPKPVRALVLVANDPLLCYENSHLTYEALTSPNLELLVAKDFYLSPSAQLADIVLPSSDWSERDVYDEELDGNILLGFQRAVNPPGECWDDWKFFLEWGKRIDPENWPWENEREMVLWRFKEFYGYDLTWDEWCQTKWLSTEPGGKQGELVEKKYEKGLMRPDGEVGFPTYTGRIEFYCTPMTGFGYDPLPDYEEPAETPVSDPEQAREFPLILMTGFRVYSFFHSAWTNIPAQRKFYPEPFALIHPDDAKKYGITDGEWMTIRSRKGHIISKASVTREIKKGVIAVPRPGWRDECPELGLPGYGWEKANGNVLIPSEPCEPGFADSPMRSVLCSVEAGRGDL